MSNTDGTGEMPFDWGIKPAPSSAKPDAPEPPAPAPPTPDVAPTAPIEPLQTVAATPSFARTTEEVPTTAPARIPAGEAGFEGVGDAVPAVDGHSPKLLWWVTGGLVALLIVVVLSVFGSSLSKWVAGTPATPIPTTPVAPTALATPGTWNWDQLFGGECLDSFTNAWQLDYAVVDCAAPHSAQLVFRGTFADTATPSVFPGDADLGVQAAALCTRVGIFDVTAAGAYGNLQVQSAYPVTAEQWESGQRAYFCFVNRADGSALTGSVSGPGPQ